MCTVVGEDLPGERAEKWLMTDGVNNWAQGNRF